MRPVTARRLRSVFVSAWLVIAVVVVCFPLYYVFEGALTRPGTWTRASPVWCRST